jgi:hypothetical protein
MRRDVSKANGRGRNPRQGSIEHLGLIRLETHYDEYLREVQAGNLKTAARYFRQQIEGKELIGLAWEQSAEASPSGRESGPLPQMAAVTIPSRFSPNSKEKSSPSPIDLVLAVHWCYTLLVLKGVRPVRAALACGHLLRL